MKLPLEGSRCSCTFTSTRAHARTRPEAHARWLAPTFGPGSKLALLLPILQGPAPLPAPLSFCLHLFYIWRPHYVKFLHTANTFNLLPAKFRVTFSDFFFFFYCQLYECSYFMVHFKLSLFYDRQVQRKGLNEEIWTSKKIRREYLSLNCRDQAFCWPFGLQHSSKITLG